MFPESNPKPIIAFVKNGKGKRINLSEDLQRKKAEMIGEIIELDPFSGIDKERINKVIQEEDEIE
jgi:hypothetical protein